VAPAIAESSEDIARCYPVMHQLRTHVTEEEFAPRIAAQRTQGYQLAFSDVGGRVVAVAGFRIIDMLFSGKTLYVDDLVTDQAHRSQGHGATMIRWLIDLAKSAGCETFSLDSGVQRARAHAFYFDMGMHVSSFHFELRI
jgi:GNAT superfamily N-acetyltransferase